MKNKIKTICFDIDGVVCKTNKNFYKKSKPIFQNIKIINKIYLKGYRVILFTARFMGRSNENVFKAKKRGFDFTKKQLSEWGVKYDKLIFGKPSFDLIIDDKSLDFHNDWSKKIFKKIK